jgi:Family of unknown function (DUF6082)
LDRLVPLRRSRLPLRWAGVGCVALFAMAATVASAVAPLGWRWLHALGQTLSVWLSVLAIGGVAISLFLQIHQLRIARFQSARTLQLDLMQILMDDDDLLSWFPGTPGNRVERRRLIYMNLMWKYLEMGLEIGYVSEASLREHLRQQISTPTGHRLWSNVGQLYRVEANTRARHRFAVIADEVFAGLNAEVPKPDGLAAVRPAVKRSRKIAAAVGLGVLIAALASGSRRIPAFIRVDRTYRP